MHLYLLLQFLHKHYPKPLCAPIIASTTAQYSRTFDLYRKSPAVERYNVTLPNAQVLHEQLRMINEYNHRISIFKLVGINYKVQLTVMQNKYERFDRRRSLPRYIGLLSHLSEKVQVTHIICCAKTYRSNCSREHRNVLKRKFSTQF